MANDLSDYEKLRLKNIEDRKKWFSDYLIEHGETPFIDNEKIENKCKSPKLRRSFVANTEPVRRSLRRCAQKKKSPRLAARRHDRKYEEYSNEENSDAEYSSDSEDYHPRKKYKSAQYKWSSPEKKKRVSVSTNRVIIAPSEVTQEMLDNIAVKSKKTYSTFGTSCHQCRQKTVDTKTSCRSEFCIGVRGQFCGPCLKNRYGEVVADALLNPEWSCPPCRGLCNCSICRHRSGLAPTGILVPLLKDTGYNNVSDFLNNFT